MVSAEKHTQLSDANLLLSNMLKWEVPVDIKRGSGAVFCSPNGPVRRRAECTYPLVKHVAMQAVAFEQYVTSRGVSSVSSGPNPCKVSERSQQVAESNE